MPKNEPQEEPRERGQEESCCCVCCEPTGEAQAAGKRAATIKCGPVVLQIKVGKPKDCDDADCQEDQSSSCCD